MNKDFKKSAFGLFYEKMVFNLNVSKQARKVIFSRKISSQSSFSSVHQCYSKTPEL